LVDEDCRSRAQTLPRLLGRPAAYVCASATSGLDRRSTPQGSRKTALALITCEFTQPPVGPARNETTSAMSSGCPNLSSGGILRNCSTWASDLPFRNSSVATGPGATALTVISRRAARWRVRERDPPPPLRERIRTAAANVTVEASAWNDRVYDDVAAGRIDTALSAEAPPPALETEVLGLPAPGYTLRARHSIRYWPVGHNDMPCWPARRMGDSRSWPA
jgi:hypothetical protein